MEAWLCVGWLGAWGGVGGGAWLQPACVGW